MDPVKQSQPKSTFRASEYEVVRMLNGLMNSLHLPIPVISPTDLTPSLLFAILESLLGQRVPLPPIPNHRDNSYNGSTALKVQKVKLFLGVLEADILQGDVGLSNIDPRRLAAGEYPEALFVGKVLCMVGLRLGLIPSTSQGVSERQRESTSPDPRPARKTWSHTVRTTTRPFSPQPQAPSIYSTSATSTCKDSGAATSQVERKTRRGTSPKTLQPRPLRKTWSEPAPTRPAPQPQPPSRYATPELDTTCVFYAPSSTNTRDTHTMTSIFDDIDSSDSSATSPDPSPQRKGTQATLHTNDAPTPSSVALDFEPPFQSPPLPSSTRYTDHNPSPSLLLSVEHDPIPAPRSKKHREPAVISPIPSRYTTPQSSNPTVSKSSSDFDFHLNKVAVRHSGYIEPVDEDLEIASYEHSRPFSISFSSPRKSPLDNSQSDSTGNSSILKGLDGDTTFERSVGSNYDADKTTKTIAAIHEEYERTLKLLDERTKLLQELAELNISR